MSKVLKLGLAGCGSVSQRGLLPNLTQEDTKQWAVLHAVMDPVPGRAEATAEKFGAPLWFEDYDEMLASDIDAVVIASPIGWHYEQSMKAIAAGKHLHLNKTMTTTKAEADEVIAAAQEAGIVVVASPGNCRTAAWKRIHEIIASGEIGQLYWAETGTAGSGHEYEAFRTGDDVLSNVNPAWYYRRPGGGPMYDMCVYALHNITGVLGPVKQVTGFSGIGLAERSFKGQTLPVDMDDNTHLVLDFGDNVYCLVFGTNSFSGPARPFSGAYFSGSEGAILNGRGGLQIWTRAESEGRVERHPRNMPFVNETHQRLPEHHVYSDIMHMVDCVLNDKAPVVTAEHARHVIEIIELGYAAAATRQTQALTTTFEMHFWD
jgi:predicted dehydrogenase